MCVDSYPKQAGAYKQAMKLSEVFALLQYPGLGPTSDPPYQYILFVWQGLHSPSPDNELREYSVSALQALQAPVLIKASPAMHALRDIVKSMAVFAFEFELRYAAFDGIDGLMPVVVSERPAYWLNNYLLYDTPGFAVNVIPMNLNAPFEAVTLVAPVNEGT